MELKLRPLRCRRRGNSSSGAWPEMQHEEAGTMKTGKPQAGFRCC